MQPSKGLDVYASRQRRLHDQEDQGRRKGDHRENEALRVAVASSLEETFAQRTEQPQLAEQQKREAEHRVRTSALQQQYQRQVNQTSVALFPARFDHWLNAR